MKPNVIRSLGVIAITAAAWWVVVVVAMHFLEPEFDPIRAPASAYVLGSYGHWMTTTYFMNAAAYLSVVIGVGMTMTDVRLKWFAMALFALATTGTIIAGLYPMDYPPPSVTESGKLHDLGGAMGFPSLAVGALMFSLSFRRSSNWVTVSKPAIVLSLGVLTTFVVVVYFRQVLGYSGFAQRILFVFLLSWLVVVGRHLILLAGEIYKS